jgi:hypothetical protein
LSEIAKAECKAPDEKGCPTLDIRLNSLSDWQNKAIETEEKPLKGGKHLNATKLFDPGDINRYQDQFGPPVRLAPGSLSFRNPKRNKSLGAKSRLDGGCKTRQGFVSKCIGAVDSGISESCSTHY